MAFSEEEIITVLKKGLPKAQYKDLENIAKSILDESERWQEEDLNRRIHDEIQTRILKEARNTRR